MRRCIASLNQQRRMSKLMCYLFNSFYREEQENLQVVIK